MALLQVVGIASILPFMQLVSDPEILGRNETLKLIQDFFGIESTQSMLVLTGFGVLFLLTVGNLFSAFTVWLQYKYAWEVAHNISTRLLNSYLNKQFDYFLNVESSVLINKTVVEVARFSREVLIQIIEFAARITVVAVITGLLIWVDPILAISAIATFSLAYLSIYAISKNYLLRKGEERTKENETSLKSINDAFNGIKTVKIYSAESLFYRRFERASLRLISMYPKINLISTAPRYIIEIIAFGGILGVILYFLITGKDLQHILPILSLYALAGYRLLPSLQKAFAAASSARHSFAIVENIYQDLQEAAQKQQSLEDPKLEVRMPLFSNEILFQDVGFQYGEKSVFENLNLNIKKGSTVGLVGSIGSGKSTLINLIAGLIQPQQGSIRIDNTVLDDHNTESWKAQIGYVPQEVFLFDDTIYRNIAMGVEDSAIDMEKV
jgi:ATP-binding cassette subfamily C protein